MTAGTAWEPTETGEATPTASRHPGRGEPVRDVQGRRIIVMRHGVTEYNLANIVQGQLDIPLSPEGEAQAALAAPFVARMRPDLVISSDLRRASYTAFQVAAQLQLDVVLDPRLRESASGTWEGMPVDQLDPVPDWTTFGVTSPRGGPEGESVIDVVERVRPLLDEVRETLPEGGCALLVTHGVTARALTAELVGLDQGVAWVALAGLHNCGWGVIEEGHRGWRLRSWNLTAPEQADLGLSADSG
ncbi:MAG: histidine phosphatase family protein [Dermatophilus congolensis]|nr:histidine phosphatase family protein [Dermatophilus congolensis]